MKQIGYNQGAVTISSNTWNSPAPVAKVQFISKGKKVILEGHAKLFCHAMRKVGI